MAHRARATLVHAHDELTQVAVTIVDAAIFDERHAHRLQRVDIGTTPATIAVILAHQHLIAILGPHETLCALLQQQPRGGLGRERSGQRLPVIAHRAALARIPVVLRFDPPQGGIGALLPLVIARPSAHTLGRNVIA